MTEEDFSKLKEGDRVMINHSGAATIKKVGKIALILKCDKPTWSCPIFYRHEIKEKI